MSESDAYMFGREPAAQGAGIAAAAGLDACTSAFAPDADIASVFALAAGIAFAFAPDAGIASALAPDACTSALARVADTSALGRTNARWRCRLRCSFAGLDHIATSRGTRWGHRPNAQAH